MDRTVNSGDISCADVLRYICEQFGEDDESPRCLTVKAHLAHCPDCARYCDSVEKMIGLYRAASPQFPEQARDAVLAAVGVMKK